MNDETFLPLSARAARGMAAFKRLRPGTVVFVLAILARLCVLFRASDTTHFLPIDGDMKFYSDWALRIAGGQWTDHQSFYGLPLYAYLLAALYRLLGFQPYIALLLQVLAEATTALLIFRVALLAFAPPANAAGDTGSAGRDDGTVIGVVAALGWTFFVPAQAYATILMPTTYFVAAFWFVVWWTLRQRPGCPPARAFFLLGLFMGFVAMMVANILFLSGFVLAGLFFKDSWKEAVPAGVARWRTRAVAALLLFGGIGLGASPCWVHNYFVAGEPVLLSAHSGINFYIGNNPEATGYPRVPAGMRADQEGLLKDSITFAEKVTGHPLRHYEVSAFWSQRAHRYIADHPGEFVRLLGVKLGNFWNTYRYDDLGVIIPLQEDGILWPGIGFGTVALLGLPGLVLAAVRRPRARWVVAAVLIHMGSLLTVFITERYRLAAVPGLLLLASFGVVECARLLAGRRWVPAIAYAALVAAAFFSTHLPLPDPSLLYLDDYNTGVTDLANHHLERARAKLERVYAFNHDNAESCFAMGNLALADNQTGKALWFYSQTLRLDPRHYRAMNNLGVLAMEDRQWRAAESLFDHALKFAPRDAKIHYLLARVHLALHDLPAARSSIDNALEIQPERSDYQKFRADLDQQTPSAPL